MRILYTLFLTAMVAIAIEKCRGEYLLVAVEDDDDLRKPKNDDFRKNDDDFRKPKNDDFRAEKSRGCYDCGFIRGICCKFGNGTERCERPENCPTYGKETRVINEIDCEKIKEELMGNNNGGEHLVCNPEGKPECSTLKLSSIDVVDHPNVKDVLAGTYQFIGEWKNVGSPIYRQVDGDPMSVNFNKFYLYYSSKQWIVQKKSIGASKHHELYSKHCKVDDYEDCSGKWKVYRTTKSYNIKIECETTEDKDDLIVADKKKMCLLDCPPGEMCFPTQPPMCARPIENAETPKEAERLRGCYDCGHSGMICCKFGNGTEDCEYRKKCPTYVDKNAISKIPAVPCEGRPTFGLCDMLISGFTFDQVSKTCKSYDDGGCGETKNSFRTVEECETKCKSEMQSRTHCPGGCPIGTICCLDGTDRCESSAFNCN